MAKRILPVVWGSSALAPGELVLGLRQVLRREREELALRKTEWRRASAQALRKLRVTAQRRAQRAAQRALKVESVHELSRANRRLDQALLEARSECVRLALAVAEEIVGIHINSTESIVERVSHGISTLTDRCKLTLGFAVGLSKATQAEIIKALSFTHPDTQFEIALDETILPQQIVIESIAGRITLNWQEHFSEISQRLLSATRPTQAQEISA